MSFVAVVGIALVALVGGGSASAVADVPAPPLRAVTIDPQLTKQLAAQRAGVAAIITAWSRRDLAAIERLGVRGAKLRVLPMILTPSLTRAQLRVLRSSPLVRSIWANTKYELTMEDTTWLTRARYTWSSSRQPGGLAGLGITGRNVHLAVIDTGVDGQHEDMDNLVEFCETQQAVATADHTTVVCSPFNPASGNAGPAGPTNTARGDATDDNGHGTHVSGTVAGNGDASGGTDKRHSTLGLAPRAKLHVYSANVGPSLLNQEILAAYDDMINKKLKGLSAVVAVNNSFGGSDGANYNPDNPQSIAYKRAYDAGILPVFAAGNSGPEHNTLSGQCVSPWVLCVAASTKPDSVVMFSSRGRPSEPADTNRDGVVGGPGDIQPDNHDRRLGQLYDLGVYRPGITAPGVNINSISANSPQCREILAPLFPRTPESAAARDCYEQLNGTSMAAPHVVGAAGLVVEAYRKGHGGKTPSPGVIMEILERSANQYKLPGYETEEQGAGRLDTYSAVKFALTYPNGLPAQNLGTPSPPYAAGKYPGAPGASIQSKGCAGTLSWTARTVETPLDPVGQPPLATARFGQHFITVPPQTERLRVTVSWPQHPGANLYARLWRPGVNPDADTQPAGQTRAFPDQEALGLLDTADLIDSRFLDIRAPEETSGTGSPAAIPSGTWILRVYHRASGAGTDCDPGSSENPKQAEGFNYDLDVELPEAQTAPTVAIASPQPGSPQNRRWVTVSGTAAYPTPWDGVTNYEVPGSGNPSLGPEAPDTRTVLRLHGNAGLHASGEPGEAGCTGDGLTDLVACDGPFLLPSGTLSPSPAASWKVPAPLFNGGADRNIVDPNWVWNLTAPTTVAGPMTVEWWASCSGCADEIIGADWTIRLWADGVKAFEQRISATPTLPNIAQKLSTTVNLPSITASTKLVLHIDPVYLVDQANTFVYYDSTAACPTATTPGPCDSLVRMPVVAAGGGGGGGPATPNDVRVTDVHNGLRIAWNGSASSYEIYRSTTPTFAPTPSTRIATTAGAACNSPDVPTWPTASRPGLCYTDAGAGLLTTYYYRVVAKSGSQSSKASLLAYGTRTQFDRQVKLKVDRLYGPQMWEFAGLGSPAGTSWTYLWDTVELLEGERTLHARSFTQGIGSAKASRTVKLDNDPDRPPPPKDDDADDDGDDDGDGDDDDDEDDDDH